MASRHNAKFRPLGNLGIQTPPVFGELNMSDEKDESTETQFRDAKRVRATLRPRLERAERAYSQALTSLWLGNAGAALATLSFIGAAWKNDTFSRILLWPLGLFVLGIVAMGVGAVITLIREKLAIERMQRATSIMDFHVSDIESPAERIGLTFRDYRTSTALFAGCCFIAGCVVGFFLLASRAA